MTVVGLYGLIDSCNFVPTITGSVHAIDITGGPISSDGGVASWQRPLTLGTNKAVYIEDCTFDYTLNDAGDDCIDCYGGARWVIRHCTFIAISHGHHGLDSGSGQLSPHSFEIYNNTYTNSQGQALRYTTVRGGTGVIFNNTYGGTKSWNPVTLQYYRAYQTVPAISWAICDGTNYRINGTPTNSASPWVLSTTGTYAYDDATNSVLGVFGAGFGTYFDGAGTNGYPGRQQPGYTTGQVQSPLYVWNQGGPRGNTVDIWAGGGTTEQNLLAVLLQDNRDYIRGTPKPGYSPYAYPHPLTYGGIIRLGFRITQV